MKKKLQIVEKKRKKMDGQQEKPFDILFHNGR